MSIGTLAAPGTGSASVRPKARHRAQVSGRGGLPWWTAPAVLAGLALWVLFCALVLSTLQETGAQRHLYASLREQLALETAPLGGPIRPGAPVALLDVPAAGVRNVVVVQGTGAADTAQGPGHLADTPLPGQAGVSVVFGRSTTFGGPFARVPRLRAGARISVTTGQGTFRYRVDDVRQPGDALPAPVLTGSRLTLVTAQGRGWRSWWAPDHAVFVDATLVSGPVQPSPPGAALAVGADQEPMRGQPSALLGVVLWLQAASAAGAGLAWAAWRWGAWQAWLVGVPVLLAVLWMAADSALLLLPNLL